VYDHDQGELEVLRWEEFVTRQWESIFAGYHSWTGLRRICRRWGDFIEAGLGCPQDIADLLVRAEIIDRPDRDIESAPNAAAVLDRMAAVLPACGLPCRKWKGSDRSRRPRCSTSTPG
jgi:hypothetical protein